MIIARMQEQWLQRHDRDTAGIMGMLPLIRGLPVRLTEHKDKLGGAFKNSQAILVDWELDAEEEARVAAIDDNEIQLAVQPKALHLRILKGTKHLKSHLGEKMLRLVPVHKVWCRVQKSGERVSRWCRTLAARLTVIAESHSMPP